MPDTIKRFVNHVMASPRSTYRTFMANILFVLLVTRELIMKKVDD